MMAMRFAICIMVVAFLKNSLQEKRKLQGTDTSLIIFLSFAEEAAKNLFVLQNKKKMI